jgi:hypothetical protein
MDRLSWDATSLSYLPLSHSVFLQTTLGENDILIPMSGPTCCSGVFLDKGISSLERRSLKTKRPDDLNTNKAESKAVT